MKSQRIRIRNIPADTAVIRRVRVKPMAVIIVMLIMGIAMLFMKPYLLIASLTMIMLALFSLFVMPDRILCEFTDRYLILYNDHDRVHCWMIYYEDIVSWQYEWHPSIDTMVIHLVDGTSQSQDMYSLLSVYKYMHQYAPGKMKKYGGRKSVI